MTGDILSYIKDKYADKYAYLRLGRVDVLRAEKRINVVFLVPENVYDYKFNNSDIDAIKTALNEILNGEYTAYCRFEKIVLSKESFTVALVEYCEKKFPLIYANTDFSLAEVQVDEGIHIKFTVQENISSYMQSVGFDKTIKEFCQEKFAADLTVEYNVVQDSTQSIRRSDLQSTRYGKSVPVTDKKCIYGKARFLTAAPIHIAAAKVDGQEFTCCGKVTNMQFRTRSEDKAVAGKRFFPYYYTFSIGDTTDYLNIFVNADEEIKELQNGVDVMCFGKITQRDERGYSMYCKAMSLCKIPYDFIKEQTKPLPAPDNYCTVFPKEYVDETYMQTSLTDEAENVGVTGNCPPTVCASLKTIKTERSYVPYEIALIYCNQGKILECMHTYFKVSFADAEGVAEFANQKGYSAPRLSSVIPDIFKFCDGKIIVAQNPQFVIDTLNVTAKPMRYLFVNETKPVAQYGKTLTVGGADAMSEAVELAKIVVK